VTVPPESRFITELWRGSAEVVVEAFLNALEQHRQFRSWNLEIDLVKAQLAQAGAVRYADAIAAVYDAYAKRAGKKRWGDKTPRYVEHIPFIAELFPGSRFVHLVRDGRDVALSYAKVPFGPKTVAKAASLWAKRVLLGVAEGRALGDGRYREFRYEDLVEDAEGTTRSLCTFLGIEFVPEMMEYTEKASEFVLEKATTYNPKVLQKPSKNKRSWETEMPARHEEVFEAVAGDVLDLFDYPRRFPQPSTRAKAAGAFGKLGLPIGRLKAT
jgi:Sulfotransferase family